MKDLATKYLGLHLKNPVIVGSCGLTNSADKIVEFADNNAGAVVLKSLFEEQILAELNQNVANYSMAYPDAYDYVRQHTRDTAVDEYLELIGQAKKRVDIPIIASINCMSGDEWVNFAKSVENEGADALEINISLLPSELHRRSAEYEKLYFDVLEKVADLVSIPIALKMSIYSSSLANLIARLSWSGKAAGFVLFNRYFRPDFDIEKMTVHAAPVLSTPEEISIPLRWIALLSQRIESDLAASTGVHDSSGVIKQLLAGATAVQVVSALYKNGAPHVNELVNGLQEWMERHSFASIAEFRGKLAYQDGDKESTLQRIQFMKHFAGIE